MDVFYINQILSTSSLKFKTLINEEPYLFFVKTGDSSIDVNDNLVINDCIEDKTFIIPCSSVIFEAHGRDDIFHHKDSDYDSFVKSNIEKIRRNNKVFEEEFEGYIKLAKNIDNTSECLQILKLHRPEKIITVMNMLGITDLASYYAGGERAASVLRSRSLELLSNAAINAREKLNLEKEKFLLENDLDSVEEIDIILDMIDNEVSSTTFETISCIEDIYTQWPPILLPVPIERHAFFT